VKRDPTGDVRVTLDPNGPVTIITGEGKGEGPVSPDPSGVTKGTISEKGDVLTTPVSTGPKPKRPHGGFKIDYKTLGPDAFRAQFARDKMEIQINLDYPEISMFGEDVESFLFRAMIAEIAISEYGIAAVNFMIEYHHMDVDETPTSALIEYRRTINRLGRGLQGLMMKWQQESKDTRPG
jgi:hypothetical protein